MLVFVAGVLVGGKVVQRLPHALGGVRIVCGPRLLTCSELAGGSTGSKQQKQSRT